MRTFPQNKLAILSAAVAVFVFAGASLRAQSRQGDAPAAAQGAGDTVRVGTRFLVQIGEELNTKTDRVNQRFHARTIEPLESAAGVIVAPGAEIRGHISRIEPAGVTGRARLWLTFDDIATPAGRMPIVAEVVSVPGDFSVKPGESKEGEIEARTGTATREAEAAAAGAAAGAAAAGVAHGGRGAAEGAVAGGISAFLISSGLGQDLDLPRNTKLELVLDRPLYVSYR